MRTTAGELWSRELTRMNANGVWLDDYLPSLSMMQAAKAEKSFINTATES